MPKFRLQWQPPPLYFIHIQKTAGTSLESWLKTIYSERQLRRIHISDLCHIAPPTLANYRCWQSHYGVNLLPFLPQLNFVTITLLRDPVEQVISHIYYVRNQLATRPNPQAFLRYPPETMLTLRNADLQCWLADPSSVFFDNFQTRSLGCTLDLRPWFKTGEFGRLGQSIPFTDLPPILHDEADLQQAFVRACHRLAETTVVGTTERFPEFLALTGARLGVPLPKQMPMKNIGSTKTGMHLDHYRQQTEPHLVETVEARNSYDRKLYTYACELLTEQWARHQTQPQRTYNLAARLRRSAGQAGQMAKKLTQKWMAIRQRMPKQSHG